MALVHDDGPKRPRVLQQVHAPINTLDAAKHHAMPTFPPRQSSRIDPMIVVARDTPQRGGILLQQLLPMGDDQDAAWQASVTDEHIEKIVMYGGAAVGRSPTMPGNPDLMSRPEVVRALVAYVRGLARR